MLYKDKTKSPDERARDLLLQMNLDEKIGQLVQTEGFYTYDIIDDKIVIKDEYAEKIRSGKLGAVWAYLRADWWTGRNHNNGITVDKCSQAIKVLQDIAMNETRLGIPIFIAEECAHGLMALDATVFPTGLGQASTFNPDIVKEMGNIIASETRAMGAHIAYGPVLDVARDPRWSRVEEGYGEDPCVISKMAKALVTGLQGDKFEPKNKVISTLKHFAAHGEPEGGHNSAPAHLGEHDLREYHLRGFKAGVDAGALSLMASYNDIDGVPCTGSRKLLTRILREEWGFDGFVVSDAGAISGLVWGQRVAKDNAEAAALALYAGVDMDLCAKIYEYDLYEALDRGIIRVAEIDTAVMRIIRLKFAMGLFENPYIDQFIALQVIGCKAHRNVALKMAEQSMTLIKNKDQLLPLKKTEKIAVVGPNADTPMNQLGDYTAPQKKGNIVTVLSGIKSVASDVSYAKGCKVRSLNRDDYDNALQKAKNSDVVIAVLGGSSSPDADTGFLDNGAARVQEIALNSDFDKDSGEGYDRAILQLAGLQVELLQDIKKMGKKLVVVLIQGRPLIMDKIVEIADAVLLAWYPGCEGGLAVANTLFGINNPAGRLPVSVPKSEGQLPIYYNSTSHRGDYIDMSGSPSYSFGYGLSYTNFAYSDLELSKTEMKETDTVTVSVTVSNIGDYDGDEVIQLYIRDCFASMYRPQKELKAFKRVNIKKGESQKVTFEIGFDELAFYNEEQKYVVEKGDFEIYVGGDLHHNLYAKLKII